MNAQPVPVSSVTFSSPLLVKQFASTTTPSNNPGTTTPGNFAFARIQSEVRLVQLIGQSDVDVDGSGTPLLDIHIFKHEFVSMFRYAHTLRVHPLDIRVLEPLDDHAVRYEEDNGTVFLAKDLMAHLKRIMDASALIKATRSRRRC